jgi:hypothetical protein
LRRGRKNRLNKEERTREKKEKKPEISKNVYGVHITIELPSSDLTAKESHTSVAQIFQEATLTLTYTTTSASWTPHYSVHLDTTNSSLSSLTYRAHFTDCTYETWSEAVIMQSTSQASFGGLKEKIPQMERWRMTLRDKSVIATGDNGLYSLAELKAQKEAEQREYGTPMWERNRLDFLSSVGGAAKMKMASALVNINFDLTRREKTGILT